MNGINQNSISECFLIFLFITLMESLETCAFFDYVLDECTCFQWNHYHRVSQNS